MNFVVTLECLSDYSLGLVFGAVIASTTICLTLLGSYFFIIVKKEKGLSKT